MYQFSDHQNFTASSLKRLCAKIGIVGGEFKVLPVNLFTTPRRLNQRAYHFPAIGNKNVQSKRRFGMPRSRSARLFLCAVVHGSLLIMACVGITALLMSN